MADTVELKGVVKHLVNGTLDETLCRVCLLPLGEVYENINTKVCKGDREFCVAEVLKLFGELKFLDADNYNVCSNCFVMAATAYKFFLLTKRSDEILNFYVDELEKNIDSIPFGMLEDVNDESFCFNLPIVEPFTDNFDYDIQGCLLKNSFSCSKNNDASPRKNPVKKIESQEKVKKNEKKKEESQLEDKLVVVIGDDGKQTVYKLLEDGSLDLVSRKRRLVVTASENETKKKRRRKRFPMVYTSCSQCSVKYRFLSKLKMHMKTEHNIDLFVCKICKTTFEDEEEFNFHLQSHTNVYRCEFCNMVFKKPDSIIAHLKWHENMSKLEGTHVCELCGFILPNEEQLKEHYDKKHDKKYTCFYCGRMYKGETSFETHIKKHEEHMKSEEKPKISVTVAESQEENEPDTSDKKRAVCVTCGRHFVDERSLKWHSMLHSNERPYACDVCGRAFVSVNRRNQHAVCAHTAPTRRCPLCPALFHLCSMVNTHIKRVHLKAHKRRNRTSKHQNVSWRTEAVPIQDLSVPIQNELLELKTNQDELNSPGVDDPAFDIWTQKTV